jgi:hypothetical protein
MFGPQVSSVLPFLAASVSLTRARRSSIERFEEVSFTAEASGETSKTAAAATDHRRTVILSALFTAPGF